MKKHLGFVAGVVCLLSSGAAMGADINGSLKDGADVFSAPKEVNWSGFYIGGAVGYGNSNHNLSVNEYYKDFCSKAKDAEDPGFDPYEDSVNLGYPYGVVPYRSVTIDNIKKALPTVTGSTCETLARNATSQPPAAPNNIVTVHGDGREIGSLDGVNAHGVVGDVRLGYDRAFGRFLIGAWGSYGFNGMEAEDVNTLGLGNAKLEKQDEWAIGLRAGAIVAPRTLVYALAGWSHTSYDFSGTETISDPKGKSFSKETDFDGVVVGGGVEFALMSNVFLGLEYQHTFYGEETIFDVYNKNTNVGGRIDDDLDEDKVMGTLKIKLNGGLFD